jgi:hypothetical protein
MIRKTLVAFAGLALAAFATAPADAQVRAGMLTCNVAAGMGFVIGSQKNVTCNFRSVQGWQESYAGQITRLGLDVGFTEGGTIAWAVYPPLWAVVARLPEDMVALLLKRRSAAALAPTC